MLYVFIPLPRRNIDASPMQTAGRTTVLYGYIHAVTLPLPLHTGQSTPRLVFPVPEHLPHIPTGAPAAGVCCCCIGRGGVAGTVGNVAAAVFGSASIVDDGATIQSGVRSTAAIACAVGMS